MVGVVIKKCRISFSSIIFLWQNILKLHISNNEDSIKRMFKISGGDANNVQGVCAGLY